MITKFVKISGLPKAGKTRVALAAAVGLNTKTINVGYISLDEAFGGLVKKTEMFIDKPAESFNKLHFVIPNTRSLAVLEQEIVRLVLMGKSVLVIDGAEHVTDGKTPFVQMEAELPDRIVKMLEGVDSLLTEVLFILTYNERIRG